MAITRSLIHKPEILILDKATSALDMGTERNFQCVLDVSRQGLTTTIIAHRLSTIMNEDVIFVMDQGRIVEKRNLNGS
ncbi:hypothetical protein ASG81_22695 [Paenibacillus sp. Soil522]|nr:hypothetical protein ASG81_22695 [Paenibacillus sp. Soil522]